MDFTSSKAARPPHDEAKLAKELSAFVGSLGFSSAEPETVNTDDEIDGSEYDDEGDEDDDGSDDDDDGAERDGGDEDDNDDEEQDELQRDSDDAEESSVPGSEDEAKKADVAPAKKGKSAADLLAEAERFKAMSDGEALPQSRWYEIAPEDLPPTQAKVKATEQQIEECKRQCAKALDDYKGDSDKDRKKTDPWLVKVSCRNRL